MAIINLATNNIDYSNPEKALRQIHTNVCQLKETLEMSLNNIDAANVTLDNGQNLNIAISSENLRGPQGVKGDDGEDGFSPKITVKTNTATEYILTITTKDGSFDTPNLRGGTSESEETTT